MGTALSSLQSFILPATKSWAYTIATGDFNDDDIIDVAMIGEKGVWVFMGVGNGVFKSPMLITVPTPNFGLAVSDVNDDGKLDLIASENRAFAVLLGKGDGTFEPEIATPVPFEVVGLVAGDLNRDGNIDVVAVNGGSQGVGVFLGGGSGTFAPGIQVALPGYLTIAIGDVNGDHIPDLVSDGVYVALGKGDGTFQKAAYYPVSGAPSQFGAANNVMLADLRGIGRLDIVTGNVFNSVSVLLNTGKGTYIDGHRIAVAGSPGCAAVADYNMDGKPDVAVNTTNGVAILLSTGVATSPLKLKSTLALSNSDCLVTGDFNNDGVPDLLVPSLVFSQNVATPYLTTFLGSGNGDFIEKGPLQVAISGYFALGDFNGDGKLDYATSGDWMAFGNGDGTFQTAKRFVPKVNPKTTLFTNIVSGDLNGDGRPDIVLTDGSNDSVYVLFNEGGAKFSTTGLTTICMSPINPVIGDLNGDGKPDLIVGCGDGGISVYLNAGSSGFTYAGNLTDGFLNGAAPLIADVNGDGIPDIAAFSTEEIAIWLGIGDGTFEVPVYIGAGESPGGMVADDLHGQGVVAGAPDLVITDVSGYVEVILNTSKK